MRKVALAGGALVLGLLVSACGDNGGDGNEGGGGGAQVVPSQQRSGYWTPSTSTPRSPMAAKIGVRQTKLGKILVDDKGRTLYLFAKDKNGKSTCYGGCAIEWPPLLTTGAPVGTGLKAKWLGVTKRTDGTQQVTYHKWPLYYYDGDSAPGDMNGQDVTSYGAPWYVIGAETGKKLEG